MDKLPKRRILIIDDNPTIHEDFKKILIAPPDPKKAEFQKIKQLLGVKKDPSTDSLYHFEIDSAFQGKEGLECVKTALENHNPYALAFIDMRMAPGWNGLETTAHIWKIDPKIQVVICTAYSDYSWMEIISTLGHSDSLLILRKPFDSMEIKQLAYTLTDKWQLSYRLDNHISNLQRGIEASSDGIIIFTSVKKDFPIIFMNYSAQTILTNNGITRDFFDLLSQNFPHGEELVLIQNAIASREEIQTELFYYRGHKKLWFEVRITPIVNKEKESDQFICLLIDTTKNKQLTEQLIFHSTHDLLTGLPNRALLMEKLQQNILQAKEQNLAIAIFLIDLDQFKRINDGFGHEIGDLALKQISQQLSVFIGENDLLARIGADEFIITRFASRHECQSLIEEIMSILQKPIVINPVEIYLTCCIGVSFYPIHGKEPIVLIKNANIALSKGKEKGQNNWQVYNEEYSFQVQLTQDLENALRDEKKSSQFELYYQPLVNTVTKKIVSVEALVRWNHPSLGQISPQVFIPIAEKTGLIIILGEWIIKTACLQITNWKKQGIITKVSVNISPRQLTHKNFVKRIQEILRKEKLTPDSLELEITESFLLDNGDNIQQILQELKMMRLAIIMDDFGTGYSSLGYLQQYPFSKIKIDKIFIDNISWDIDKKNLVKSIIDMATYLNMSVVAEGVETQEQYDILETYGSLDIQGYIISPPVPHDKIFPLLIKNA